jgi:hypothetical protein
MFPDSPGKEADLEVLAAHDMSGFVAHDMSGLCFTCIGGEVEMMVAVRKGGGCCG